MQHYDISLARVAINTCSSVPRDSQRLGNRIEIDRGVK